MNTSPSIHSGPLGMSIAIIANRHVPPLWMTRSLPGTENATESTVKTRSGMEDASPQSIVYCPRMFGAAPAASAILAMSVVGPVMRDVPESTMPLVGPEEKGPDWTLPMSICQYLGTERGIQAISPVYLASSVCL